MNVNKFDKFLFEDCAKPKWVYVSPRIWGGYWSIKLFNPTIRKIFRYLGRKIKNKYLYWVGLPLYWERGVKEIYPDLESQYALGKKYFEGN